MTLFRSGMFVFIGLLAALAACSSGPQITRTQELAESADAPYEKILVITLLSSFDSRRFVEEAIVGQLEERGIEAVRSTSLMDTRTPVTRETFVEMVDNLDADGVLLTQMVSLRSEGSFVDMNPQRTLNLQPTGYWNWWTADVTEYVEPQGVDFDHSLELLTELFSVRDQEKVWGIVSRSDFTLTFDRTRDASIVFDEAKAIVRYLSRDGVIAN